MFNHSDTPPSPSTNDQDWTNIKRRLDIALNGIPPTIQPTFIHPTPIHAAVKYCFRAYDRACQRQRCPMFKAHELSINLNLVFREMGDGPPFEYKNADEVDRLTSDLAGLELCRVIAKVVYTDRVTERIWERIREAQEERYESGFDGCV
ncbi:hypothetical protein CLAFUR0_07105 [Fulvia fulva]|nr:hypothetical protein CLAFUR0_07105 [Fulvia fulva]